jgi:AMMECR1 domain-containing protein
MEESIKILEEMIESAEKSINRLEDNDLSGTMRGVLELRKRQSQSLLNLINRYKELEKESFEDYKSYFDLVQEDNELLVQKENKIKELEKERDGIYADYQDLGKEKLRLEEKCEEQEKMIELMAKAFKQDDIRNEDEIIEYFRNEVKKNEKSR